jgi:hypothetical protein
MKTLKLILIILLFSITFLGPLIIDWYMDKKDKEL